ncbi:MAG: U32 family peptidase [Christensenellaceae bacterium]|nr:U32 family peptidase [Christensenellaceae bacterium]
MSAPELLAPAGGPRQLAAALRFGADAVYLGGKQFGLRAFAGNFSEEALVSALDLAHKAGKKAYVTVNAFLYEQDLEPCAKWLRRLCDLGADAAIVSDPAAVLLARREAPSLPLHLSTQANTLNSISAGHFHALGVSRVIAARELSLEQLGALRQNIPETLQIESFVHGAICASYSGRCVLSNHLAGRDANQGACAQPCRWKYALVEEKRPGQFLPVFEDESGSYIYSADDLCMLEHLTDLLAAGVSSFKIEGRMKNEYYVALSVLAYRRALDAALEHPERPFDRGLLKLVHYASHRRFSTGFYYGTPKSPPGQGGYSQGAQYVARVLNAEGDESLVEQKNRFFLGEDLLLLSPAGLFPFRAEDLRDEGGSALAGAPHPEQRLHLNLPNTAQPGDLILREEPSEGGLS